mmetsp:Transcript_19055/g.42567  ORF Transcript_19055/g.42567 Transcript_19055/m.42567 type:complete len:211 (-) Transcript_19055:281-913(-)
MIALVVAIAGMMFPAISLTSHRDCIGMWKMLARKLEAAVTKSNACGSSLSNVSAPTSSGRSSRMVWTEWMKTAAFSAMLHTRCSSSASVDASGRLSAARSTGTGFARSFHKLSIARSLRTSCSKTTPKMRFPNSAALSPCALCKFAAAAAPAAAADGAAASAASSPSSPVSAVSTRSVSSPPKIFLKRSSFAQAMQWTGLSGWFRIVQIG